MNGWRRVHLGWVTLVVGGLLSAGGASKPPPAPNKQPAVADTLTGTNAAPELTADQWLEMAKTSQQRGMLKKAVEFATKAVEAAPRDPRPIHFRAVLHERMRELAPSEADLSKALELAPDEPALWSNRGIVRLRLGDFAGSVADFERFAELRPAKLPELWQRGIALFYVGRYEDARRQFELHRTVNPQDVENSAWHFCCLAKTSGFAVARANWMPVEADTRIPMREIQLLFAGKLEPEAVLAAAAAAKPERRQQEGRFYAEYYLALYHGAEGKRALEATHAAEAAKLGRDFGIMGELAKVHADWVAAEMRRTRR